MAKLHEDFDHAQVALVGCVSHGSSFGTFRSKNGRRQTVMDAKAVAYYLTIPKFKVIQYDANGKVLSNSEEERKPKNKKPTREVKANIQGDGWGEMEMQDEKGDAARAEMKAQVEDLERAWLEEELGQKKPETSDAKEELKSERPADQEELGKEILSEVFGAGWKPGMGRTKLHELYEQRTGETLEGKPKKRELIAMHEALDESEQS